MKTITREQLEEGLSNFVKGENELSRKLMSYTPIDDNIGRSMVERFYKILGLTNDTEISAHNKSPDYLLICEDGSTDTDKLEEMGFDVVVYRQGSNPPYFIKNPNKEPHG